MSYNTYGKQEMNTKFWFGKLMGRNHLGDLITDRRIILNWI